MGALIELLVVTIACIFSYRIGRLFQCEDDTINVQIHFIIGGCSSDEAIKKARLITGYKGR